VKKWSLILFTILSQMAVGAFWILMASQWVFRSQYGDAKAEDLILVPLLVVEAIMLLSLLVSFAHLGSPMIAYRAISNFRSSWLSREISFALLFILSSGTLIYFLWARLGSVALRLVIAWLAALFGYMFIYSMSRLYMLRTVPVWNTLFTPLSFYLTTLILGGLAAGVLLVLNRYPSSISFTDDTLVILLPGVLFVFGGEVILVIGWILEYFSRISNKKETTQKLLESHKSVFNVRIIFGLLGLFGLIILILHNRFTILFFAICFVLIMLAQLADRFLFYAARDVSGI